MWTPSQVLDSEVAFRRETVSSNGALDKMMNPREADEQRREEANYARHLSLLESANRILQNPNSKFIAEWLADWVDFCSTLHRDEFVAMN